ncbi:hypothetical protein DL96DRAFT_1537079 [Flagelloscypha sp. PMI_526]|nr:hypothetical protein DL96DRAFT_1537079 [Flagelloscypha sp. PMI_526]
MSENIPELVIRNVTPNIITFSKPFTILGFLPWGGRSTAIKLENGSGVWVLASTPLTLDTKTAIDALGEVKWIMAADRVHYLYLAEFAKAYPEAKVILVKDLVPKMKAQGVRVDGAYGTDPEGTLYGFEDEIDACYFSGSLNKDVVWCHKPSGTVLVADLFYNLPAIEQYSKSKQSSKIPLFGTFPPSSKMQQTFLASGLHDKAAMKRDVAIVNGWKFDRIIMCHGDVIESGGKKAWGEAYAKFPPPS